MSAEFTWELQGEEVVLVKNNTEQRISISFVLDFIKKMEDHKRYIDFYNTLYNCSTEREIKRNIKAYKTIAQAYNKFMVS